MMFNDLSLYLQQFMNNFYKKTITTLAIIILHLINFITFTNHVIKLYSFINLIKIFTYEVKQIHFEFWYPAVLLRTCLVNNLLRLNLMEIARVEEPMGNYTFLYIL